MAKKSRKRIDRHRNEDAGCIGGLINMFDFRQGHSSQKLLSDKKQGSSRHFGTKYLRSKAELLGKLEAKEYDGIHERRDVHKGRASVKSLMQEEISRKCPSKRIPSDEVARIQSELGLEVHSQKYNMHEGKSHEEVASDLVVTDPMTPKILHNPLSNYANLTERSSLNFEFAKFMIKFYGDSHQWPEEHMDSDCKIAPGLISEPQNPRKLNNLDEPDFNLSEKQSMFCKALTEVADLFLSQKPVDVEHLNRSVQSSEFMDAVEILNSNKELLLGLLQDPSSLLSKNIQDYKNALNGKLSVRESGKKLEINELLKEVGSSQQCDGPISHKSFNKQNGYNIFKKKDKSKGIKPLDGNDSSDTLNRIVILKPSQVRGQGDSDATSPSSSCQPNNSSKCQEHVERVGSNFSFKEIKRRLRHVIGENRKEAEVISRDGILHRVPYGSKDSTEGKQNAENRVVKYLMKETQYDSEQSSQSCTTEQKREKRVQPKECQQNECSSVKLGDHKRPSISASARHLNKESFYDEAKKHLIAMLHTGDNNDSCQRMQVSKSLGRVLSLPEYNLLSPRLSPGMDQGPDFSLLQKFKHANATNSSGPVKQDFEKMPCGDDNLDEEAKMTDSISTPIDSQAKEKIRTGESLCQREIAEIVELDDTVLTEEYDQLNVHLESDKNEPVLPSTASKEEGSPTQSGMSLRGPDSLLEKPEQPSPISVLEAFSSEDVDSPMNATADFPICPQSIQFDEPGNTAVVLFSSHSETVPTGCTTDKGGRSEYIKAVLDVSTLSCEGISERWLSSAQLLDTSMFDEVEISYSQLSDPKLLFDCICDVLEEIRERHSSCTPWVSFIKLNVRPIPVGNNLIQEVCRRIDRLVEWRSPRTLDHIVSKDMEGGNWLDLRYETECIATEIEDYILEELVEEAAFDMWFEFFDDNFYVI